MTTFDYREPRRMSREELLHHVGTQRLALSQRRLEVLRQIRLLQREVDSLDDRLIQLDHAEGRLR